MAFLAGKPKDRSGKPLPPINQGGSLSDPFREIMAYAIIQTGGRQFRVQPGDIIDVELLGVESGDKTTFDEVLLASDDAGVKIGDPLLKGASVAAEIIEGIRKSPKVVSYKFKRRKGYHRTVGHRQKMTRVKVGEIKA
tara:strand:- start:304 stop:717 length:414 start_codon:yes stop_codon:yes gene_type:complete